VEINRLNKNVTEPSSEYAKRSSNVLKLYEAEMIRKMTEITKLKQKLINALSPSLLN
jgi:hypothetical protein